MADTLSRIAQAASEAGFMIRWDDDDRLVIAPEFHRELKEHSGNICLNVFNTPVGIRWVIVEDYAGFQMSPIWAEDLGSWIRKELRNWCSDVYWWTFRWIWGWQVSHPWESLELAHAQCVTEAARFHSWCEEVY